MEDVEIIPMESSHIDELASTHAMSLPEDLLPAFGEKFMANVYYKSMLSCPYAIVFVALHNKKFVGFVNVATTPEGIFPWLAKNYTGKLISASLQLFTRKPSRLLELVRSLRAKISRQDPSGEIAFIAVNPNCRRQGIGGKLIAHSNSYLFTNNFQYGFTKTLSSNLHIVNFYQKNWNANIIDRIKIGCKEYVIISWPLNNQPN